METGGLLFPMFMDEKGRWGGRVSVVDLLIGAGGLFLLSALYFGVIILRSQHLAVYRVLPDPAVPGDGKPVAVIGTGFVNGCTIRLGYLPEETGRFINEAVTEVDTPEVLSPGSYSVQVRDPMGHFAQLTDGLRIRWNPRIERLELKRTYPGEQVEIDGRYFDAGAKIRLGDIPLHSIGWENRKRLLMKVEADRAIPPGVYNVTLSNPGGGTTTVQHAIEVLPRPEVTRVYPDVMTFGEKVTLTIEGENLPRDAAFYLDEGGYPLKESAWISPQRVKVPFKVEFSGMSDWYGLVLGIPGGPKILVKPHAIRIIDGIPVELLVELSAQGMDPETLEAFRKLPESRLLEENDGRHDGRALKNLPIILWGLARMDSQNAGWTFSYQDKPLTAGGPVTVHLFGREVTGTLLREPIPIGTADEWRKTVTDGKP